MAGGTVGGGFQFPGDRAIRPRWRRGWPAGAMHVGSGCRWGLRCGAGRDLVGVLEVLTEAERKRRVIHGAWEQFGLNHSETEG